MKYTLAQIAAIQSKMEKMGGGFVSSLAVAMLRADAGNLVRIVNAFPELMDEYWDFASTEFIAEEKKSALRKEAEELARNSWIGSAEEIKERIESYVENGGSFNDILNNKN